MYSKSDNWCAFSSLSFVHKRKCRVCLWLCVSDFSLPRKSLLNIIKSTCPQFFAPASLPLVTMLLVKRKGDLHHCGPTQCPGICLSVAFNLYKWIVFSHGSDVMLLGVILAVTCCTTCKSKNIFYLFYIWQHTLIPTNHFLSVALFVAIYIHTVFVSICASLYMFMNACVLYCCSQRVGQGWHGHCGVGGLFWHHFHVLWPLSWQGSHNDEEF